MIDQENPKESSGVKPTQPNTNQLMSEKEKMRWYLKESAYVRANFGFGIKEGKLVIVDTSKIKHLPEDLKVILRELYKEMR